jgi:alpha-L-fucosidase 2
MHSKYISVLALLVVCFLAAVALAQTASFNTGTGMMDVDYSGYLSKHDIIYNHPITNPVWGATVGNGRVGAMVWSANGLTMQVGGVDTSEETAFSGGTLNLHTNPGMDTGYSAFQQRLSLYNGILTTTYDSNRTVTIMGSPNSEVMGINVNDTRSGVTSVTLDLSIWNVSQLSGGSVPNITTWQTVSTYANAQGIGLSRGQADPNNFGYTLAATVSGTSFTTQTVNSNTVRLIITPAQNYTIWFVCASRLNAPNHNSVAQAQSLLANAVSAGYASTLANFENWWHAFWAKSFVQYSNSSGDADYMENMYYLYEYIIACGGYANYPFHFINGDFSAVQDQHAQKWSYGYWYWNERDIYNSFLASNHPEILKVLNNLYFRNLNVLESYTKTRYGISGVWVPETIGWDGNANGTINSSFTKDILSSGTEAAQNMYLVYKYTGDASYLANVAYPFMRQIAIFYTNKLSVNGSGQYYMAVSNSHETYWDVQDAITDLAAIRSLFPEVISAAQILGQDSSLVPQWQNVLNKLVPYPSNGTSYLPNDPPAAPTHNFENVVSELLWPYSVTGIGFSNYSLIDNAWLNRPFPYDAIWAPDAVQAARLGLGDSTYSGMRAMLEIYQNYPNGRTNNTNGEFEFTGLHLSAMSEQLLQSYNDVIRVFPAQPSDSSFVSSFTLAAKNGFLVSSERDISGIKYVGIKSLLGNTASVYNPWGTEQVDVRNMANGQVVLTTSSAQFSFATASNTVYVVERTTEPFGSFPHVQLTGSSNNNAKLLDGGACQLGLFVGAAPDTGKYQAEKAVLSNCIVGTDYAASGGAEVTNISTGSSVTFNNVRAGQQLLIGYCTESNPGKMGLYVNGSLNQVVTFPTTNSWSGHYSTVTVNVNIPQGASIKLQNDPGDAGTNLDYIQVLGGGSTTEAPFGGTPAAIPGTVQAENYDVGGQGVAYSVNSINGTANSYRSDGVDLETTSDTGGGENLGWTASGQWFRYTVNVASAGTYTVQFRVAAPTAVTDAFHVSNSSGTNLSGAINIPATGGWQTWTTVTANVTLPTGQQVLTFNQDNAGWNINYATFAGMAEAPFGGTPAAIPGTVQAENYDVGGQGIAYSVKSINGTGNSYRSDGVDLETTTDTGGGFNLGWTASGQWFRYTVNVATAGTYAVKFRVAAPNAVTDAFHVSNASGTNLSGSINIPATGGWQTWTTVTANVTLPAGQQVLTLNQDNAGWNINYATF